MPTRIFAEVRRGVLAGLPVMAAAAPLSMLFGTLCTAAGLTPLDALALSAGTFAGASQFVAIDLYGRDVPFWPLVFAVFAVNFRHLLYSASLTAHVRRFPWRVKGLMFPFLVDPVFAFVEADAARGRPVTAAGYFGMAVSMYVMWVVCTAIGALGGRLVDDPKAYALDLLLPLYFLGLVMGFRRRRSFWPVVLVSAAVSAFVYHAPALGVPLIGPPWHVTLGALAGIFAAALGPIPSEARVEALADAEARAMDGDVGPAPVER